MQNTYGCIKWNVPFLPREETQESQQQKMEKLKLMFQHSGADPEEVKSLMKSTFYTQSLHVNQGKRIRFLREEQPFCFDEPGMSVHFKEHFKDRPQRVHPKSGSEGKKAFQLHELHSLCPEEQEDASDFCKASEDAGTAEWLLRWF